MSKVLVTGGTGFIAGHTIQQLLQKGYKVVTTVRSDDKGDKLLNAHAPWSKNNLSYTIVKDVTQKGAFDEAIKTTPDLDYVIHTASPYHYDVSDPVANFLEPAITGTTSILQALHAHSTTIKRVVLLSSFAAMRNDANPPPAYDESSWNPVTWDEAATNTKKTYQGSKTLSERAAWDFIREQKPQFDLVAINPTLVFGPIAPHLRRADLPAGLNTSNQRIFNMLSGAMHDGLEPTGFYTFVDVRDVAAAHVAALELPRVAARQESRCLMIAGHFSNVEIARVVQEMMGKDERMKALPETLPEKDDLPPLDQRYRWDCSRSQDMFGVRYRGLEECVRNTVESLRRGLAE